jgi:uncharacterized protein (TIGR00251 family)
MTPRWVRVGKNSVTFDVKARPGAGRSAILGADHVGLIVAIGAAAERGNANDELERFIAKLAQVPRADVTVVAGRSKRNKSLRIKATDPNHLAARLFALGSPV